MRKNYEGMLNLLVSKKVFKKGEVIDRWIFGDRIVELGLEKEFNKEYNKGFSFRISWNVWNFSDRFNRFMKKCVNNFEYLGRGKYLVK